MTLELVASLELSSVFSQFSLWYSGSRAVMLVYLGKSVAERLFAKYSVVPGEEMTRLN